MLKDVLNLVENNIEVMNYTEKMVTGITLKNVI